MSSFDHSDAFHTGSVDCEHLKMVLFLFWILIFHVHSVNIIESSFVKCFRKCFFLSLKQHRFLWTCAFNRFYVATLHTKPDEVPQVYCIQTCSKRTFDNIHVNNYPGIAWHVMNLRMEISQEWKDIAASSVKLWREGPPNFYFANNLNKLSQNGWIPAQTPTIMIMSLLRQNKWYCQWCMSWARRTWMDAVYARGWIPKSFVSAPEIFWCWTRIVHHAGMHQSKPGETTKWNQLN